MKQSCKTWYSSVLFFLIPMVGYNQVSPVTYAKYDSVAKAITARALDSGKAYEMLTYLCTQIGHRLSGSLQAEKAVNWTRKIMENYGFENVHLEPVMVPHWVRGKVEEGQIIHPSGKKESIVITAFGGSVGTPKEGITAEVLEVKNFDELKVLGEKAKGKIIFFNRPFDRTKFNTFEAYGGAVDQRSSGALQAGEAGAAAALVRSMTFSLDEVPHTGAMRAYVDSIPKVPGVAISTNGADRLSGLLKEGKTLKVKIRLSCETLPDIESANVVGEIRGSEKPEEVIVIGGHLDSWDKGQGAHDDGAGCVQSIEALRLLKEMGLKPKRTIRAVMFMNEENGLRGGKAYAENDRPGEKHIAAIETDAGGFTPRGFGVQVDSIRFQKIARWESLFKSIDADRIRKGGGGADISPLEKKGVPVIGLQVDSQRYFDYHHSDHDTIDKVNERELELGAAAIAILSYILAEEGM